MLKYELIQEKGDNKIYQYEPESKGEKGTVSINISTGETHIIKMSENDIGNRYARKLVKQLSEFFAKKDYKTKGFVAWY